MVSERPNAVTMKGNPLTLQGEPIEVGQDAPDFRLVGTDMSDKTLADYEGKVKVIAVVPSVDTSVCDTEVRSFNEQAANLNDDIVVLTVSVDTPPALKRWCGAAGIERVHTLSDFRDHQFGQAYGVRIKELGLLARTVIVLDRNNRVTYVEQIPEIAEEPDYAKALEAAKAAVSE